MSISDLMDENDYEDFLQEILDAGQLDGVAEGITKLVIDKGESSLSAKQEYVFRTQVKEVFITGDCNRCGADIPWSEMYEANDNGGFCSWCAHQIAKGN